MEKIKKALLELRIILQENKILLSKLKEKKEGKNNFIYHNKNEENNSKLN
tara:strand:- start:110 stop:259 length:150 start_codon:yes stop_codon:yes gene_type:complete